MTHRTRLTIFALILAWLVAPNTSRAAVEAVALPTPLPSQAQGWDDADAWSDAEETQAPQEDLASGDAQGETAPDEAAADDTAADDAAADDAQEDVQDTASGDQTDFGGENVTSSTVQNRTQSEQMIISETEKKLQAALHTEVVNPDLSIQATLGYDGIVTYLKPVPIEVTLHNSGGDLEGSVCVNLYRSNSYYDRVKYPLFLPAGSERRIRFYVTLTMKQDAFTIEYCVNDKVLASVNASPLKDVSPNDCLISVLSSSPGALNYLDISLKNDALLRGEYFQTVPMSIDSFPDTASALNVFGILAVDGIDLTGLSDAQKAAFDAWLRAGGVALVGGGAQAAAARRRRRIIRSLNPTPAFPLGRYTSRTTLRPRCWKPSPRQGKPSVKAS